MKKQHIVQISSYYPPNLGGQENAVHDLATQLATIGHDVNVITSVKGGGPYGTTVENAAIVHRLWGFVFGHAPIMPTFPWKLLRKARSKSVVHLHIGQAFTPEMVWLSSKLGGFKYIAQLHIDFEPSGPAGILLPFYKRFILGPVLRSASAVIVLNQKTLRTVRDVYRYKGKILIMNNGIDEAYFAIKRPVPAVVPPPVLRLLFVGRLSKQKNVEVLLDAIKATNRNVHLDIIGDGEQREVIKKMIKAHNLTNTVLRGRLARKEVMDYYESCDALIMPSTYEAQPLVLLEAMAAGVPIIGTNVIGVKDHIKDIGIIVEPTAKGLIDGIEQYYTRYSELPEMVERGRTKAGTLRWSHTLKKYEALYEEVIGN
jgi:glycosyltransferase involved in cell wall biosynthesis